MQKLFSYILLLSSLFVGCIFPTIASFAMNDEYEQTYKTMSYGMKHDLMMPCESQNNSRSMHQCCISPFTESVIPNTNILVLGDQDTDNNQKVDGKIHAILDEDVASNTIHRLNSPPKPSDLEYTYQKTSYLSLVGIIKNNS